MCACAQAMLEMLCMYCASFNVQTVSNVFEGLAQHVLHVPNIVPNVWPHVPNGSNIILKFGQPVHIFETILF
jgi:hypothetical protein